MTDFDGETFDRDRDGKRLSAELVRVKRCMADGQWRTLPQISAITHDPLPGISARLRDLRKAKFGSHIVERRYVSDGLWEYRLTLRQPSTPVPVRTTPVAVFGMPETGRVR